MVKPEPPVRWAPRLQPTKLRLLYERDAQGMLDEQLLDDVGYTLYSRCRIEGNRKRVLALLDTLTYGPRSTVGTTAIKAAWRAHWQEVQAHEAEGRTKRQAKRAAGRNDEEQRSWRRAK